jgi:divalent metal cation (Fe/Co/Zn/Cd) transporter
MPMPMTVRERRAVRLERFTVGWNAMEGAVGLVAGIAASSIALVAYGLDSLVEVASAIIVLWHFRGSRQERERRALRLIAVCFFGLALYVVVTSLYDLATGAKPETSPVGIAVTAASVIVMPILARAKRRTATAIGSRTVLADSKQSALCAYLSATTLCGLGLNAALGWWWADPLAALFTAFVAVREGREFWAGRDECC